MPLIIANINGWKKEFDVSYEILAGGELYIPIHPPMEFAFRKSDIVVKDNIKKVRLVRTDRYLFEYLQ